MRPALAYALALSLLIAGCSGGGGDSETAEPASAAAGAPAPDAGVVASYDLASACDLLGVADVEVAAGGTGWGVVTDEPGRCIYSDPEGEHTVTLTVTSSAAYNDFAGAGISAGAGGMRGLAAGDTYAQVWAPAGANAAVVLTQDPASIASASIIGLTETAAIALENTPAAGSETDSADAGSGDLSGAGALTSGLNRVAVEGSIPATGNTISIEVTAAQVAEVGVESLTTIACVGARDEGGLEGSYAVLAMNVEVLDGLTLAQLEITEEFNGPGTYTADVRFAEADGDSFDLSGTMTVAAGLESGTYDVKDRSGAQVTGSWVCEFAS